MRTRHLTLKVFLLILVDGICSLIAQVVLKKGLVETNITIVTWDNISAFITKNAASPIIWLGIFLYAMNFFIWIVILYKVDLSIAVPVGSMNYILIPIIAMLFFHEHVDFNRWLGIALIVTGIHFVSKSGRHVAATEVESPA